MAYRFEGALVSENDRIDAALERGGFARYEDARWVCRIRPYGSLATRPREACDSSFCVAGSPCNTPDPGACRRRGYPFEWVFCGRITEVAAKHLRCRVVAECCRAPKRPLDFTGAAQLLQKSTEIEHGLGLPGFRFASKPVLGFIFRFRPIPCVAP